MGVLFCPLLNFFFRREPTRFCTVRNDPSDAFGASKAFVVGEPFVPVSGLVTVRVTEPVVVQRDGHLELVAFCVSSDSILSGTVRPII